MSDIRTFRAASIADALSLVREELGSDAVVLHSQETRRREWRRWFTPVNEAVVVARRDTAVRPASVSMSALPSSGIDLSATEDGTEEQIVPSQMIDRHDSPEQTAMSLRLTTPFSAECEIPEELFRVYAELLDLEIHDEQARSLILKLKQRGSTEEWTDRQTVWRMLQQIVEAQCSAAGPIDVVPGKQRLVALVGPTGVGKTTTIAKLAAAYRLREKRNVALITVDTYRVAAVQQLRTYADLIDLPMHVVGNGRDLQKALHECRDAELILIDTAGRSPRDELRLHELRSLLAEAGEVETHLVLSLATSLSGFRSAVSAFEVLNPTRLILTKLDEAAGLGTLCSAAELSQLSLSYLTTGQDVPDDIEVARSRRAARLALGLEDL